MKIPPAFRDRHLASSVLALTFIAVSGTAQAQLRLPTLNLPLPQRIGPLDTEIVRERLLNNRNVLDVRELRLGQINGLLRRHPELLEADPRGEPVVRRELLAWSPGPQSIAAARAAGLTVLREQRLDGLDETLVVFQVPPGAATAELLERLRSLDPQGSYDFNHVYTGSGAAPGQPASGAPQLSAPAAPGKARIGLVDSGVDASHPVFAGATLRHWGCAGTPHPHAHGTAVAALMVGQSRWFRGVAPQASLYAADIYCDSASGGSAERIAAALAWLAREQIAVINLSIVGPPNVALERAVAAMLRRGHLLVAAVGNDGPAAPPLYPASYPGVVGVSAIDKRGRLLPEAARGPQVMFAAPGNQMVSASVGQPPYRQVRGTSFAAPIVAAMLAPALAQPDPAQAASALAALAGKASPAEGAGRGSVGLDFRVDPGDLK